MKNFNSQLTKNGIAKHLKPAGTVQALMVLIALITSIVPSRLLAQAPTLSYSSPQTYTEGTAITPLTPISSGVGGFGSYNSPVKLTMSNGFTEGIALDAAGNVYVSYDDPQSEVFKITPDGTTTAFSSMGLINPRGLAVDMAGNVYVADLGDATIKEIPANGGTAIVIYSNLSKPEGVAVDANGNLYVADVSFNAIVKIPPGGTPFFIGSGFNGPDGVAVDASGNVYVSDSGNNEVKKIPVGGGAPIIISSGLSLPNGVAVDNSGNVYVSDRGNSAVKYIKFGTGGTFGIAGGFDQLYGVAVDQTGKVYATAFSNFAYLIKPTGGFYITPALPAGLNFDNATGVISGTPTGLGQATTYTVTAYNGSGSATANFSLAVNPPTPPTISYSSPQTYAYGTLIPSLSPSVTGGVAAPGYSNSPVNRGAGFFGPNGVAADAAGNVYVADYLGNAVKEIPVGGGAPIVLGSGFNHPTGVAVDAAGNIYIADDGNSAVKKIPAGSSTPVAIGSGFSQPYGIAVDAAGNVYVADASASSTVTRIPVGGGAQVTLGSGFTTPTGVAVDALGNVFVADEGNSAIKEIPIGGGNVITIASGFNHPYGVAVDALGNLYVADSNNNAIKEIPLGSPPVTIGTFPGGPPGVAIDTRGNVYVADYANAAVRQISPVGGFYISAALPAGLNFDNTTGIISGTPNVARTATNYIITAYNALGGGSATVNITVNPLPPTISYASPQTYAVNTAITPLVPTSSGVAGPAYSSSPVNINSSFDNYPTGVASDAQGNFYVAVPGDSFITKIPKGGGTPTTVGSGINSASNLAVDAAGNIYVADFSGNVVTKIPAGGGTQVSIGGGYNGPVDVAVDAAGNVYVADYYNNAIKKVPVGGGAPVSMGSGFSHPNGVAVDAAGNVYVVDSGNKVVKKIPKSSGVTVTLSSSFTTPTGIALDFMGNIFVSDAGNGTVNEMSTSGGTVHVVGSGFNNPSGVAVNPFGSVYVAAVFNNAVYQITPVGGYYINTMLPAGLSFNSTLGAISGTPTTVSPATNYTVTAYNAGGGTSAIVNIKVALPNATLSNLKISAGALSPAFAAATNGYTAAVANAVTSLTITPTTTDPAATVKVNGTPVTSGSPSGPIALSVGANTITTVVTNGASTKTYTVTVTRAASNNAYLATINLTPAASLTVVSGPDYKDYTASVPNTTSSVTVTFTTHDPTATVKVNGTTVASGTPSGAIALSVGPNAITIVSTAQDGVTTKTYGITVTRAAASPASLSALQLSSGTLTPVFATATTSYTASVPYVASTITITPTTSVGTATIKVNGTTVASGAASGPIALSVGSNTITTVVTNGPSTKTYTVTVTRAAASNNAYLATINLTPAASLTVVSGPDYKDYTASVSNTTSSVTVTFTTHDPTATVKVNGTTVASGTPSGAIALSVGPNTITIVSTAQDGVTAKTYGITVTRMGPVNIPDATVSVTKPAESPQLADGVLFVHQGVSPNGDGINDFLQIDGILAYPDNKLLIMNRNGALVYEAKGYDNSSHVFDGHSNKNGQMQLPGTYFYSLDYNINGINKHKTGFLVLKY